MTIVTNIFNVLRRGDAYYVVTYVYVSRLH